MCMCVYLCGICTWVQGLVQYRGVQFPEAGVTGGCERSEEGVGN